MRRVLYPILLRSHPRNLSGPDAELTLYDGQCCSRCVDLDPSPVVLSRLGTAEYRLCLSETYRKIIPLRKRTRLACLRRQDRSPESAMDAAAVRRHPISGWHQWYTFASHDVRDRLEEVSFLFPSPRVMGATSVKAGCFFRVADAHAWIEAEFGAVRPAIDTHAQISSPIAIHQARTA